MINYKELWSLKKVKAIVVIISLIIAYNIYSKIDSIICRGILDDIKIESQKDSLTLKLISMMQDTISKRNCKPPREYIKDSVVNLDKNKPNGYFILFKNVENWYWEDIIVFNKKKTKGFSFVYQIDKSKGKWSCDYVKYYLTYKMKNGNWYFYTDTPILCFGRDHNEHKPYTKEIMQDEMYMDLAKYVNIFAGKIDPKFVDEWFENESVNDNGIRALLGKKLK